MPLLIVGLAAIAVVTYTSWRAPNRSVVPPGQQTRGEGETAEFGETEVTTSYNRSEEPIGHQIGDRAPDFTLRSFNGEDVRLSDYRGRVVILDFWASWCVPCRLSMPTLEDLARRFSEVVLLGVSLDRSESDARSYLASKEFSELIAVWGSQAAASSVARTYGVSGIPRTFVIDRDGIVRFADHPTRLSTSLIESLL